VAGWANEKVIQLSCARLEHAFKASRKFLEGRSGPNRPPFEFTAAVGAAHIELRRHALGAKGTLEAADPRVFRIRRQIKIAAFAIGL